jgi:bacterioferritin (cytochrome b1)
VVAPTLSRRRLLATAGASAVLLAGCGDDTKNPNVRTAPDESDTADVELLNTMLDLELETIAAYKTAAGGLRGGALQVAKGFLEQEQAHADALAKAIGDLNGVPNQPKSSYSFRTLRSQRDVMRFAVALEDTAIAAYIDVLPKLSPGAVRSTISAILTTEAEHLAVWRGELGDPPAPAAFVVGRAA